MKTYSSFFVTLGLSGLAACFLLLFTRERTDNLTSVVVSEVRQPPSKQKPARLHQGKPDDLPITVESGPQSNLERFRSTRLSPEVLKRDAELFARPSRGTAKEFRESLSRHFPVYELALGQAGPEMYQCLKDIEESLDGLSFLQPNEYGRIAPGMPLIAYIHRVLDQSAPQEERNYFCRVVDSLIRMCGDHPDEPMLRGYLMHTIGDHWTGWVTAKGRGAEGASAIWRSSEVFRHLAYGEPPVSEHFKECVRLDNQRNGKPGK